MESEAWKDEQNPDDSDLYRTWGVQWTSLSVDHDEPCHS